MIYFEAGKELDVRLYKTAVTLNELFRSCGKYIISGDDLILLGGADSVRLNPVEREAELEAPYRTFRLSKTKPRFLKSDSASMRLVKMINDAYREWFEIDPFSNFMEFEGILLETNQMLSEFGLSLVWNSQNMRLFHDTTQITYEQGLQFILDNEMVEDINRSLREWENDARYYKESGQDEKAMRQYERMLRYIDSSMDAYTDVAFSLAELYYFASSYDEALLLYNRCNAAVRKDKRDFYVHIGHALLDRRMKNFESEIKLYYRSLLDNSFYEKNRRVVELAASEISQNYPEYEEACMRIGVHYYRENHQKRIGEKETPAGLIVTEKAAALPAVRPLKRYESIKLVQVRNEEDTGKSPETLLAGGLSELNEGEYQRAYEVYSMLAEKTGRGAEMYTWAMLQLGKLFSFFEEYDNALICLEECNKEHFGVVYRKRDYRLLTAHARICLDDFENDKRFRLLIRGKYDHYYARFDRQYHFMTRDRNLMDAFRKYEKECVENVLNSW
ncbi:MAG: hypothetical protein K6G83_03530 [Lachnospiraceae bacterium]|nr:hypothetical protein [Lachnospiraceae bacterium]